MSARRNEKKFRDQTAIQVINKCIGLKDSEIKRNNEILNKVLKHVLDSMKEKDEFFKDLFQRPEFVGSFYKRTKIGEPEEFDLNLIMKLPVKYDTITFAKGMPGCTKLKLNATDFSAPKWEKHKKRLSKWVTQDGYLNQEQFRQSMESSLSQGIANNRKFDEFTLKDRKSGPAFTLVITNDCGLNINVDLVPVLEFTAKPPHFQINATCEARSWYAVPKPHKVGEDPQLNWRVSFYPYERKILDKHGQLRPVIRQVKKLRDTQNWKIIPSYHIETLFMHHSRDIEKDTDLAQLTGTKLFLHMLERLKNVCQRRFLLNFWDPEHNIIESEEIQLSGIVGRLTKIIKEIDGDPGKMADWLLTSLELSSYQEELSAVRESRDSDTVSRKSDDSGNESANGFTPFVSASRLTTDSSSSDSSSADNQTDDNNHLFKLILNNLTLIRKDMSDLKQSVDLLSNRLANVERKLSDKLDSRTDKYKQETSPPPQYSVDGPFVDGSELDEYPKYRSRPSHYFASTEN